MVAPSALHRPFARCIDQTSSKQMALVVDLVCLLNPVYDERLRRELYVAGGRNGGSTPYERIFMTMPTLLADVIVRVTDLMDLRAVIIVSATCGHGGKLWSDRTALFFLKLKGRMG